ncbi:MAG: ribonuclease HII [Janthinobacterium lividum]
MPDFSFENKASGFVVGFDEVGCGPWAGPVVAGAALLIFDKIPAVLLSQINDSKKLTPLKRQKIYDFVQEGEGDFCITATGQASLEEIERLNIRQASFLAMARAADALSLPSHIQPTLALVDGKCKPTLSYPVLCIPKGDSLSLSIAVASIVAKVTRDQLMKEIAQQYPAYGWEQNAGYGTLHHRQALARFGVTPHHRRTFAPIARLIVS